MAAGTEETLLDDDPGLDGGEWLFRRGGQVFGPVDSRRLAAMVYQGEIDGTTPVSTGEGEWTPLADVPVFRLHAKKAEAGLRVERELTGARRLQARRRRGKLAAAALGAALLVVGAGFAAVVLTRRAAETSPLLQDFGAGIRVASAARVGVSRRADDDLVEVPLDREAGRAPSRRAMPPAASAAPAPAAAPGAGVTSELVAAHFDERKIQAIVAREQRSLAPCFREEATRSPDFEGQVPIEFVIGNDGRVAQLWIDEPRFRHGPLRDCVLAALGRWRFDPFPGQRPTVGLAFGISR